MATTPMPPMDPQVSHPKLPMILAIGITAIIFGLGGYVIASMANTNDTTDLLTSTGKSTASTSTATPTAKATTSASTTELKTFTASAQGDKLTFQYPSTYTVSENSNGFITIKDSKGVLVADLTAVTNSVSSNVDTISKVSNQWFQSTPTKTEIKTDTGITCTQLTGTLGKKVASLNAIADGTHDGISGTVSVCARSPLAFVFNAYDKGDATLKDTLADLLNTIK